MFYYPVRENRVLYWKGVFSLNFTEATSPDLKQSIRLCLAYKKEDDTNWEQISFISSDLRSIGSDKDKKISDYLTVIHTVTDKPVEKCSFNTYDAQKNDYDNGWKITQMFYFERPNKLSIYF